MLIMIVVAFSTFDVRLVARFDQIIAQKLIVVYLQHLISYK